MSSDRRTDEAVARETQKVVVACELQTDSLQRGIGARRPHGSPHANDHHALHQAGVGSERSSLSGAETNNGGKSHEGIIQDSNGSTALEIDEKRHTGTAPGVCGPEHEFEPVGAPKRGRGRPRIIERRPWEIKGISRRTWYRKRNK